MKHARGFRWSYSDLILWRVTVRRFVTEKDRRTLSLLENLSGPKRILILTVILPMVSTCEWNIVCTHFRKLLERSKCFSHSQNIMLFLFNPRVRAFINLSAWFSSRSDATENCCQIQSRGREWKTEGPGLQITGQATVALLHTASLQPSSITKSVGCVNQ